MADDGDLLVLGGVDHSAGDVLINEEKATQAKSQPHGTDVG